MKENKLRQIILVGSPDGWFLEGYLVVYNQNKNPIHKI